MKRMRAYLAAAALCAVACSKPEPPKITPHAARVQSVTPLGVGLALELDVENKNPFPLIVQEVSGTLKLGAGVEVGRARSEPKGNVPAKATTRVPATLDVPWTQLGALAPLAASGKPVPYTFDGTAKLRCALHGQGRDHPGAGHPGRHPRARRARRVDPAAQVGSLQQRKPVE
jgi:LEA14-like dessication related protein